MNWLICLVVLILSATLQDSAAAKELFSVRCDDGDSGRPYFATFDLDSKAVLFETPPSSAEDTFGSNIYSGTVETTEYDKVVFTLRNMSRRIQLVFDQKDRTMIWPGFDEARFRPTLTHRCTVSPPRSILSFRVREPIVNPVSVRCEDAGYMYFTMDVPTRRALFERGREGRTFEGEVTDVAGDEITLLMQFDQPTRVVWSKNHQTITVMGIEGDRDRPGKVMPCEEVSPRTMMSRHRER